MKFFSIAVLLGICVLVFSKSTGHKSYRIADRDFLVKQIEIFKLFYHSNDIVEQYTLTTESEQYDENMLDRFMDFYEQGFLPKRVIFSVFNEVHLRQAIALFRLFYYSRSYETFYKTAKWASDNLNRGLFVYSFSVALVHRPDTYTIILPPIYEINPSYFIDEETVNKIYKDDIYMRGSTKLYNSNTTRVAFDSDSEQRLNYFTNDIGINAYYYYYNLYYPFWMDAHEFNLTKDRRGELFYYIYQQLLARYELERLSNHLGDTRLFSWDTKFKTGYIPNLRYWMGYSFPRRGENVDLRSYLLEYDQRKCWTSRYGQSYTYVKDYERRIRDAIDRGYVHGNNGKITLFTPESIEDLGNLIESNPNSPDNKYFGNYMMFARHLLGSAYQKMDTMDFIPSAMEHFETSLRDPAFYQLVKRMVLYFQRFKSYLGPYTLPELEFRGVRISKVEVDRLETYFEEFDIDATSLIARRKTDGDFRIIHRDFRMNHKPFSYRISMISEIEVIADVKVFIGPKYDEFGNYVDLNERRMKFVQLDHFLYRLNKGENIVERDSRMNFFYGPDRRTYRDMMVLMEEALNGTVDYYMDMKHSYFRLPQRFMLPRGSEKGQIYQFYVVVYPFNPYKGDSDKDDEAEERQIHYVDSYPLGYPFDRPIDNFRLFLGPNHHFKDVKIYHSSEFIRINTTY